MLGRQSKVWVVGEFEYFKRLCVTPALRLTLLPWLCLSLLVLTSCTSTRNDISERGAAIIADPSQDQVTIMDFASPPQLKPLSPGWDQHEFFWHKPVHVSFVSKKGKAAAKFHTKDSASILIRSVDARLDEFPLLKWQWLVEKAIAAKVPENIPAGDDHPVRLIVYFEDLAKEEKIIEIIWGNQLKAGSSVVVHGYKHFVARGAEAELDSWYSESIDLAQLYRSTFGEQPNVRVTDIGIFCDSDDTNGETIAYVAKIALAQAGSASGH